MSRTKKILILLAILLGLAALLAVVVTTYQTEHSFFPFSPRGHLNFVGDFELYYMFRTILSTVNIVLIIMLIFNYVSIYQKTHSEFTFGLLLFAIMVVFKVITLYPIIIGLCGFGIYGLGPFAFLPDLFEMSALLVLFYLSVKY